jgi:pimeloyl-ACP methyl ester carboxylesterase
MLAGLDLLADLARLDVPALVLVGSRDRLTPPWHSHRMVAALPKPLGLLTAPGSGHMTPATDPDHIAAAIRGLVDDHLHAAPAAGVPTAATVSVPAPAPRSEG